MGKKRPLSDRGPPCGKDKCPFCAAPPSTAVSLDGDSAPFSAQRAPATTAMTPSHLSQHRRGMFETARCRDGCEGTYPSSPGLLGGLGSKGLWPTGFFLGHGKRQGGGGDASKMEPQRLAQAGFLPLPSSISNSPTSFSSQTLPTRPLPQHPVQCLLPASPLSPLALLRLCQATPQRPSVAPAVPGDEALGHPSVANWLPTTNIPTTMAHVNVYTN